MIVDSIHNGRRLNKGSDENGVPYKDAFSVIARQWRRGVLGFYAGVQVLALSILTNRTVRFDLRQRSAHACTGRRSTCARSPQVKVLQDVIRCVAFFYVFSTLKRAYRRS